MTFKRDIITSLNEIKANLLESNEVGQSDSRDLDCFLYEQDHPIHIEQGYGIK